ncbi:MAG: sporulation protein YqfD [Clostridia bacterium]|nr:sporulation protein YqfD [Clostridia bacterium]MBR3715754.1 sporulation protein YqfD [Clostridia bacterium]
MKKAGKSKHFGITDTILMLFFGYCEISVTSRKEDALNFLLSQKIKYNAMSNSPYGMSFRIYLYRKKMLTSYLREAGVEFSLGESRGLPALFMALSKKYGFLLGAATLLTITFLSESVIWEISVSGNESITDYEIRREMSELGVRVGARISSLDLDSICTDYLIKNTDVSWIRVNIVGSSAEIVVREKKVAPSEAEDLPSNLVALCDGYIFRVEVNSGQLLVNSGEAVLKGQVLVSGLVDNGNETFRFERSDARIFALTEESISVKIPMIYAKKRYTGENSEKKSLIFFSKAINFSVLGRNSHESCDIIETYDHPELWNGKVIPISIKTTLYKKYIIEDIPLSEKEASRLAEIELAEKIALLLGDEGILVSQSLSSECDEEFYTLHCSISCIRDIASEIPIFAD